MPFPYDIKIYVTVARFLKITCKECGTTWRGILILSDKRQKDKFLETDDSGCVDSHFRASKYDKIPIYLVSHLDLAEWHAKL
jgi:hypothetical protein